jgi:subtilisin family serine protease
MKKWFLLLTLITSICYGDSTNSPKRLIILDTGLNLEDPRFSKLLCEDYPGFDVTETTIVDTNGHGTHVAGTIKQYAKDANYCITIIKYYLDSNSGEQNLENVIKALTWINYVKPAFVNFSAGGPVRNDKEYELIKSTPETKYIVAAGNYNENLDKECNYYPACYKLNNIYRVGSLNASGTVSSSSNYGTFINFWQIGENVKSTLPNDQEGYMSGTSMAAAILNR